MATVTVNRGEAIAIPFSITDAANGLLGKRITWAVAHNGRRVLKKASNLPGSTAQVTITTQVAGSIVGVINLAAADFKLLPYATYLATLWVDDGAGNDICFTPGGSDTLVITPTAQRTP